MWNQLASSLVPFPLSFIIAVQASNPKNKMSYHRNNKNKNSENASYIHVQRDAVRTVSLNAPPHGRPPHGSYNKADVNKEPKFELCSGKVLHVHNCWFMSVICIPKVHNFNQILRKQPKNIKWKTFYFSEIFRSSKTIKETLPN